MPTVNKRLFNAAKAAQKHSNGLYFPGCGTQGGNSAAASSFSKPVCIPILYSMRGQQRGGSSSGTSKCQDYMSPVRPQIPLQERILGNRNPEEFYKSQTLDLFTEIYNWLVNNKDLRSMFKGAKGPFFENAEKGLGMPDCFESDSVKGTYKTTHPKPTASAPHRRSSSNQLKSKWTDPGLPYSIVNLRNLYIQLERARAKCVDDDTDAAAKLEGFSDRACKLAKEYTVCYRGKSIQPRFKAFNVDFHYLTLEEAKELFDIAFNLLINEQSKWFFVVVGSGNHSKDEESVLPSGILNYAKSKGVKFFYNPLNAVFGFYISGLGNNEQTDTNSKDYFDRAFKDFTEKGASSMNVFVGTGLSKEDVLFWARNKGVLLK